MDRWQRRTKNLAKGKAEFDSKLFKDPASGCWIWTGAKANQRLYGRMMYEGKSRPAHRLAILFYYGPFDDDKDVCHKCDNPPCVNPEHLFVGSRSENMRDCIKKNRGPWVTSKDKMCFGSKCGSSKLKEKQVKEIRKLLKLGLSQSELGRMFGVFHSTIHKISTGETWKHLK